MRSSMVFSFAGALIVNGEVLPDVVISAPLKKALQYFMPSGYKMLVANFKDDAAYRFFGKTIPDAALFSDPDTLIGSKCFNLLQEQLSLLNEPEQKINYLLNYATAFVMEREAASESISLNSSSIFNPVKAIAQKQAISERSVQLYYKKYYGFTAKEQARFQRFEKLILHLNQLMSLNEKPNWFDLIDAYGYYDQSHLIADFKYYIGLSPGNYIKLQQEFCVPIL